MRHTKPGPSASVRCNYLGRITPIAQIWLIVTDVARSVLCVYVCVFGTPMSPAEKAELIKMPF